MGAACAGDSCRKQEADIDSDGKKFSHDAFKIGDEEVTGAADKAKPGVLSPSSCTPNGVSCAGDKHRGVDRNGEDDCAYAVGDEPLNWDEIEAEDTKQEDSSRAKRRTEDQQAKKNKAEDLKRAEELKKQLRQDALVPRCFGQGALEAIFMGRKLPVERSDIADIEILMTLEAFMQSRDAEVIDSRIRNFALEFCDLHMDKHSIQGNGAAGMTVMPDKARLLKSLETLKVGGFWATLVGAQNAVLMIERSNEKQARVSAWALQPAAHEVLRAVPGFIRVPEITVEVSWESIVQESFAGYVSELATESLLTGGTQEVRNPALVFDFLLPAIGGDVLDLTFAGHCIGKKIRDECRSLDGKSNKRPWRRPSAYHAVKAILHFACVRVCWETGRSDYKSLMALLLAQCLSTCEHVLLDDSWRIEASRKLARRLHKLHVFGVKGDVVSRASEAVKATMKHVELRWRELCEENSRTELISTSLNFAKDVVHSLSNCRATLQDILNQKVDAESKKTKALKCTPRVDATSKRPFNEHLGQLKSISQYDSEDAIMTLFDVERDVRQIWMKWDATGQRPISSDEMLQLLPLLNSYLSAAGKSYKNDVEGRSTAVLTAATLVLLADRNACQEHLLLKDHAVGIDSSIFTHLLLPGVHQKKLLHGLETYLSTRCTQSKDNHTSIVDGQIHEHAFSVRFAQKSETLSNAFQSIQELDGKNRQSKIVETDKKKKECDSLLELARSHECKEQQTKKTVGGCSQGSSCKRCNAMGKSAIIRVQFYESLLPADKCVRSAVLFELQIPATLAGLRNILHAFYQKFAVFPTEEETRVEGFWRSDDRLKQWVKSELSQAQVQLAYTVETQAPEEIVLAQPWTRAPGGKGKGNMDSEWHISGHQTFVQENGRNAVLFDISGSRAMDVAKEWSIQSYVKIETRDPLYQNLQFAIESYTHTENHAIAQKFKAHSSISLREFETFGCLRAGIKLQLPRLAGALAQQSIAFDRQGVLDLMMAMLTQAGPPIDHPGKPGAWRRQAHELLGCQAFCNDLCSHALLMLKQYASNWTRHFSLLAIVLLARTVMQHAEDPSVASQLLTDCRDVACDWIKQVQATMARANEKNVQKLRFKLVDIAAIATLTYDDTSLNLFKGTNNAASFIWLRAIVCDNNGLSGAQSGKGDHFRLFLIRKALRVTLELENKLHSSLNSTEAPLTAFITMHWGDASSGNCKKWSQHKGAAKRWYETPFVGTAGKKVLQVDVLRGTFLVDGSPVGHLPKTITEHDEYTRLFGNATFEVQPALEGGWRTVPNPSGVSLAFHAPPQPGKSPIIIEEYTQDDDIRIRARLIPREYFKGDLPDAFIEDFSHWLVLDQDSPCVHFRPRDYVKATVKHDCYVKGSAFVLDLKKSTVVETGKNRQLVDVCSKTFAELFENVFFRMAPRGSVHVFHDSQETSVVLPRLHGLQFYVHGARLLSHEFGSLVAPNQRLGTLVGLRHGLLLQGRSGEKTLLMPHAAVLRSSGKHEITIEINKLRQPPLFVYNVRDDLRELHGPKDRLAWLYLAKLHAVTASPLPDPFLGRSGTAQALQLLSSGRCRGNLGERASPSIDGILQEIAELSPTRQFLKKEGQDNAEKNNLQTHALPSLCAHDGFAWVIANMHKEANQAVRLASSTKYVKGDSLDSESLKHLVGQANRRAYLQSRELYSEDARISEEDELEIMGPMKALLSLQPLPIKFETLLDPKKVYAVARSMQGEQPMKTYSDPRSLLLATNVTKLKGCRESCWQDQSMHSLKQLCSYSEPASALKVGSLGGNIKGDVVWLADVWLDLYAAARACIGQDRHQNLSRLRLCLAYLALHDPTVTEYLIQLGTVAVHATRFAEILPPTEGEYVIPHEGDYDPKIVAALIGKGMDSFKEPEPKKAGKSNEVHAAKNNDFFGVEADEAQKNQSAADGDTPKYEKAFSEWKKRKDKYAEECRRSGQAIAEAAQNAFKAGKMLDERACKQGHISNPSNLASVISANLKRWRHNRDLHRFLDKVCTELQSIEQSYGTLKDCTIDARVPEEAYIRPAMYRLPSREVKAAQLTQSDISAWTHGQYTSGEVAHVESAFPNSPTRTTAALPIMGGNEAAQVYERLLSPLREGWDLASSSTNMIEANLDLSSLRVKLNSYLESAQKDVQRVFSQLTNASAPSSDADVALFAAGLWPANVPNVILPCILSESKCLEGWRQAVGCFGVLLRHQQRAQRCLRLLCRKDLHNLKQELMHLGSEGWTPKDYPEWLLLELDNDFCIRPQQAAVALQMMSDDHGNRLLQLIMGGGKTAVIIPMIIASLTDGLRCVRVTVPEPLLVTNMSDWQLKLGGLLGRRMYSMMCRRELKIERHGPEILELLQHICSKRHAIITVPEHRLSLENKVLEVAIAGDVEGSAALHQVMKFLETRARDILDESDEILHPKLQLIYTLGGTVDLDGNQLRWKVAAAVLQSVARHAKALKAEFGSDAVELNEGPDEGGHHFPAVRLLDKAKKDAYCRLCELIADDFLAGVHPNLPVLCKPQAVPSWRRIVLEQQTSDAVWNEFPQGLQKVTLILRGLLAHRVLLGALNKRWRVEYGGQPRGSTQMAVPYRAKDVAAERTEFGHPDVALLLTTLHYYYQGLSLAQFERALRRLARKGIAEAQATYAAWVQDVSVLKGQSWAAVNLDDTEQLEKQTYPSLHRHMHVVDFWLDHFVFPVEAKEFERKVVATAWDLCRPDTAGITTGFSGTDDASLLLPSTIRQENMVELKRTNGAFLHNLLRKENDRYFVLPPNATGRQLLEHVSSDPKLDVLLDSGALVLELSNFQVAQQWLEKRSDRKAAVYFEGDKIQVVDRQGTSMPFALSPFERSMGECLLYLDDQHTRGSDFALPLNRRAAVTLGKGMLKDKLAQTVMRMRQLGTGHSVCFVASFEADLQIAAWRVSNDSSEGTSNLKHVPAIMSWCLSNTVASTCDKLLYLAVQGVTQISKRHAYQQHLGQLNQVANICAVPEAMNLADLYAHSSSLELVPHAAQRKILAAVDRFAGSMSENLIQMSSKLISHIQSLVPDVYRTLALLDDEHERELEREVEEETEICKRPSSASPATAELSEGLMEFARSGQNPRGMFLSIDQALTETSFAGLFDGPWDETVRVTPDFVRTVTDCTNSENDYFLRPVTWILVAKDGCSVLVSNYEAEALAAHFLSRIGGAKLHLVTPKLRMYQEPTLPSLPENGEPPIAVQVFAGSIHGAASFLGDVRSFLGLCARQPASALWREFYEERDAIEPDGFVKPNLRNEIAEKLDIQLGSTFNRSPIPLLQKLYRARHLTESLDASPVGQLLVGAIDIRQKEPKAKPKAKPKATSANNLAWSAEQLQKWVLETKKIADKAFVKAEEEGLPVEGSERLSCDYRDLQIRRLADKAWITVIHQRLQQFEKSMPATTRDEAWDMLAKHRPTKSMKSKQNHKINMK